MTNFSRSQAIAAWLTSQGVTQLQLDIVVHETSMENSLAQLSSMGVEVAHTDFTAGQEAFINATNKAGFHHQVEFLVGAFGGPYACAKRLMAKFDIPSIPADALYGPQEAVQETIPTDQLSDCLLAMWVAHSLGYRVLRRESGYGNPHPYEYYVETPERHFHSYIGGEHKPQFEPQFSWGQGGPILQSAKISIDTDPNRGYMAFIRDADGQKICIATDTVAGELTVAMRTFVTLKQGRNVPVMFPFSERSDRSI